MNSASYAAFTNTMSIRYTLAIDSSNAYIAVKVTSSPNNYAIFRKLNFANSDVNVWANKIACPASPIASWNLYQSPSIIDSTGAILYNLVSYDSIVLFFGVSLSTGAVVGSSFQSSSLPNGAWDDSETIYQYSTNIYMLVKWSTKYAIFTYSVSSSTFKDYKQILLDHHIPLSRGILISKFFEYLIHYPSIIMIESILMIYPKIFKIFGYHYIVQ